jgi:REP element-mobilizing transposase RayT
MNNPISLEPGKYYHVYNRGNNRENIFTEDRNYAYFLKLYAFHVGPVVDTFAYCLLRNHFHLAIRVKTTKDLTGLPNLSGLPPTPSRAFANFFNAYAKAFNKANQRTGALFQRPFGRIEVTTEAYLYRLVTYIHQNPRRHGFVADFREWPYSSYHALLSEKATQLKREDVLAWFGGRDRLVAVHDQPFPEGLLPILAPDDFD